MEVFMAEHKEVQLSMGVVRYRDVGRGPVLVFVHGLLVSGELWREVADGLEGSFRCIVPDLPLGSHQVPLDPSADVSPGGVAKLIAELLEALDLREVTLVGNDSGGALCQLVVTRHPDRVARLVLTTCDAFEVFPPPLFAYLRWVAHLPVLLTAMAALMRLFPSLRRLPIAYGRVSKRPLPDALLDTWTQPALRDPGVRRDVVKFLRAIGPRWTMEAAAALGRFTGPALILWTPEDRSFPLSLGERLAAALPSARLRLVEDAWVFVAKDRPQAVIDHIAGFARESLRA